MIRALIIEDESLAVKRMIRLLTSLEVQIEVVDILESVEESISFLKENISKLDLIFLDIHLADGTSFEIFKEIEINIPIIFTTAYDQYALKAFEVNSIDYLLKPIQAEDLLKSIQKYEQFYVSKRENKFDYSHLVDLLNVKKEEQSKKRFMVQVGDKIRYISIDEISLIYAESKACFVITRNEKRYYLNYTLEKLIAMLDSDQFFRINRKVITHISNFKELIPFSKSKWEIKLHNYPGFEITIGNDKIRKFKDWLNK